MRSHEITRDHTRSHEITSFWQVLTDRTFLSKPREMLLSFFVGGVVSARLRRLEPRHHAPETAPSLTRRIRRRHG